jgi:hypothetical protein
MASSSAGAASGPSGVEAQGSEALTPKELIAKYMRDHDLYIPDGTSLVWKIKGSHGKYLMAKSRANKDKYYCCDCKASWPYHGTSNVELHLQNHHGPLWRKAKQERDEKTGATTSAASSSAAASSSGSTGGLMTDKLKGDPLYLRHKYFVGFVGISPGRRGT